MSALETHGVIVFRNLFLDDEAQVVFCKKLGEVVEPQRSDSGDLPDHARPREERCRLVPAWHVRLAHRRHHLEVPIKATFLTADVLADRGGETEFASTYAAYDALSDDEKLRFEDVASRAQLGDDATPCVQEPDT